MAKSIFISLLFISVSFQLLSQDSIAFVKAEAELDYLADVMANAQKFEHKKRAAAEFKQLFAKTLTMPNSFDFKFENLDWISIIELNPTLRIISWQIQLSKDKFIYEGYIQTGKDLISLKDEAQDFQIENMVFTPENWYGALYYNHMAVEKNGETYYLLFGYDAHRENVKRKLVDVLTLNDGKINFGLPVFKLENEQSLQSRLFFNYGIQSNFSLNLGDEEGLIIRDHLTSVPGNMPGQSMINVADGTYVGYELKDGIWHEISKLYTLTMDEPLNIRPDSTEVKKEKRDLFGRTKKKKKTRKENPSFESN